MNKTSFEDFSVEELRKIAVEQFAVEIMPKDNKKTVIKALTDSGIFFEDYAVEKGWRVPEEPVAPAHVPLPVAPVETVEAVAITEEPVKIITQEPIAPTANQKYLLKMERDNVAFEVAGYRFTKEHPYALVESAAADYILTKEKGFRMAFPSELEEFYG